METSSEDVMGKHLAERVGFHGGGWDPGPWRPCRTNLPTAPSSGCPRPPLTLNPISYGAEETEDQSRGLERVARGGSGGCLAGGLALGVGAGNGNLLFGRVQLWMPWASCSLCSLRSGCRGPPAESERVGVKHHGQAPGALVGVTGGHKVSRPQRTLCADGAEKDVCVLSWQEGGSCWPLGEGEDVDMSR